MAGIQQLGAKIADIDTADLLPEGAAARWRDLDQRLVDARALISPLEDRQELMEEKGRLQNRIGWLKNGAGERGLVENNPAIKEAQAAHDKVAGRLRHIQELDEVRIATASKIARLSQRVENWIRGDGRPTGTAIVQFEGPLPTLQKGETHATAVEAQRRRLRELTADLSGTRAAPVPSSIVRQRMRQAVAALATRGAPDASRAIELGEDIEWPVAEQTLAVISAAAGAEFSFARGDLPDAIALIAWLLHDQLVARLDTVIGEAADDAAALSDEDRAKQEAVILSDMLACERGECALIELAQAEGIAIPYREETDPRAILNVELVAVARASPSGTSPEWSAFGGSR